MSDELIPRPEQLLARVHSVETLGAAYEAWSELRKAYAQARQELEQKRARLENEGAFLVGAARAASGPTAPDSPSPEALALRLESFVSGAAQKLSAARELIGQELASWEREFTQATADLEAILRERLERYRGRVVPRLRLLRRPLAGGGAILHLERLRGDEPALLLFLATGRIATHHDFLDDEAQDAPGQPPPLLYAEEGIGPDEVRPGPQALRALIEPRSRLPVRSWLPLWVPLADGTVALFGLRSRGAVLEVERVEPGAFRNVLSAPEAEALAGYFLRLQLEGKIEVELASG